ncbi:MAG: hypothetical protein Q4C65_05820 [Eubacteriales bacterium]|nr:hypothetical protein [Eubacteriales bacterium]
MKIATGARVTAEQLGKGRLFPVSEYGAESGLLPVENTAAINRAIEAASRAGGGTVVIGPGEFKAYTIRLKSHVNLRLEKGCVLRAARTQLNHSYTAQEGEGGNYDRPEVNLYAGLEDHGHAYFANSLLYGADLEDVMICGEGLIDGSCMEGGYRQYVLLGGDPQEPKYRSGHGNGGEYGEWFGNKAIALVRCKNVVLERFSLVIGGHFAIIAEGVENLLIDGVLVDTTRDALDVDCCQDVTVRNSVFNSLTDDALVMKSSFGAGKYMPLKNVLIEDCTVSGYDAGSVYDGMYTREKLVAEDRGGPTGRVKLGTESSCGYERVTVRRVRFDRSRGFALEAVDGSDLKDILFTDCSMDNVSSSPVFIRAGERGRFPVTGNSKEELVVADEGNVRLDNRNWVLPDAEGYDKYPVKRYTPSYREDQEVCVDGLSSFCIVNQKEPARINPANLPDRETLERLPSWEPYCRANACGIDHMARVSDIEISNVKITNADPRYPLLLMGLADSPLKRIKISNVSVEFRGGLSMEHATEQRQLNTNWEFSQYGTKPSLQSLPWLVNTFFLKAEGLLPRMDWEEKAGGWKADPYNVPELPGVYPEPENWGILPAYGLYARHVEDLVLEQVSLSWKTEDGRHAVVLDDVTGADLRTVKADIREGVAQAAVVTDHFRRPTNREYVPGHPYHTTGVREALFPAHWSVKEVEITVPAPGTPPDEHYSAPTVPCPETGYTYPVPTEEYPIPRTVFRPFFAMKARTEAVAGQELTIPVVVKNPASDVSEKKLDGTIYGGEVERKAHSVSGVQTSLRVRVEGLPEGAAYLEDERLIRWTPGKGQEGVHTVQLYADDGLLEEASSLRIEVKRA